MIIMQEKTLSAIREALSSIPHERCILFGSQARGDADDDSDIDLMVIVSENLSIPDRMTLSTKIRKTLALQMFNADVIVKPSSEIKTQRDIAGSLVRNALLEGIAL